MSFRLEGIDDLIEELNKASDLKKIAPMMIEESLPILEESLKETVQQEVNRGYATGEMVSSIQKSRAMRNEYGYFGIVRPRGMDSKGVRNMEKLAYLHYGTTKQLARPVVDKAVFHVEKKILDKMQEVFNRESK